MIVVNHDAVTVLSLATKAPAAKAFSRFVGRTAVVEDLNRDHLMAFRRYLEQAGYRRTVQCDYASNLRCAWRQAFQQGLTTLDPGDRTWMSIPDKPRRRTTKVAKPPAQVIPRSKTMRLIDYLPHFLADHFHGESEHVKRSYRNAVLYYGKFLGRDASLADFDRETFAGFCAHFATVKRRTKLAYHTRLRTLWRAALVDKLVSVAPELVESKPKPAPRPKGTGLPKHVPERKKLEPRVVAFEPTALACGEKPATPADYLPYYCLERGLGEHSAKQLRYMLNRFEVAIGHSPTWADFNDRTINMALARHLARGLAPESVRGLRGAMLSLWRGAYEAEILDCQPGRVRKVKVPRKVPRCWTMEQLGTLWRSLDGIAGNMKAAPSVSRAEFWRAFVALGYYTGLRLGDLMSLEWANIEDDRLDVVMSKTGEPLSTCLSPQCLELLKPLRASGSDLVFGGLLRADWVQVFFRRILRAAGLPGSVKWLRRSGASHVEALSPGMAKAFLGHRTHGLAYKHYVDPTVVQKEKLLPPTIEASGSGQ